jgi:hypothetical protein
LDHRVRAGLYSGLEVSRRNVEFPVALTGDLSDVRDIEVREDVGELPVGAGESLSDRAVKDQGASISIYIVTRWSQSKALRSMSSVIQ